nr:protein kinase-like domain, phloem protein 2-like protein [Tanacetum cinerariifolium]
FPAGLYQTNNKGFKTHVKTQLLSPSITYTVNLVYNSSSIGQQVYVDLKYRLGEEKATHTVYVANRKDDELFHMVELCQFTSDGSIVDLEIIFENSGTNIDGVEGILFQPMEIVEDQVSKDDKVENIQNWEQKLPNDYEKLHNLSKDSLVRTTKKELYSILRRGLLIDDGQQWFAVDKHGKKCLMLSARATWVIDDKNSAYKSTHETRFGEVLVITAGDKFEIVNEIQSEVLSADTTYASYFVYKLTQDQSTFEVPLEVNTENVISCWDVWFVYLVSPPGTPVIKPNFDANSYNPRKRHKLNVVPRLRSDGWMEVKVWQFDTRKTHETLSMHLKFEHPVKKDLSGLMDSIHNLIGKLKNNKNLSSDEIVNDDRGCLDSESVRCDTDVLEEQNEQFRDNSVGKYPDEARADGRAKNNKEKSVEDGFTKVVKRRFGCCWNKESGYVYQYEKKQPTLEETNDWTHDMILYFKQQWELLINKNRKTLSEEVDGVNYVNKVISKDMHMGDIRGMDKNVYHSC